MGDAVGHPGVGALVADGGALVVAWGVAATDVDGADVGLTVSMELVHPASTSAMAMAAEWRRIGDNPSPG